MWSAALLSERRRTRHYVRGSGGTTTCAATAARDGSRRRRSRGGRAGDERGAPGLPAALLRPPRLPLQLLLTAPRYQQLALLARTRKRRVIAAGGQWMYMLYLMGTKAQIEKSLYKFYDDWHEENMFCKVQFKKAPELLE